MNIMKYKLKKYFIHDVLTPWMHLENIYLDKNHPAHEDLKYDLDTIKKEEILTYYKKHEKRINFLNRKIKNKMIYSKILLFGELLANSIFEDRLDALLKNEPYDKKEFENFYDKENLIKVDKFSKVYDSIIINENRYGLCLPINAFNSSYWISQELNKLNLDDVDLKIRVDPFLKNFSLICQKSTVFSKPLNWNKIRDLKTVDKGQFRNYKTGELTEYMWKPRKNNTVVFTCEELPSKDLINLRGSRYFHAIFEKDSGRFIHCDGSIKIYNKNSFKKRCKYTINNNEINDIGKEVKIFRVDKNIPKEMFISLINSYFYWNHDLIDYFLKKTI